MIPNHTRFLEAIAAHKQVSVKFYSKADNGVIERNYAPLSYGPGEASHDELNRYWLWDYTSHTATHTLGLLPQQIVSLQVLGEEFDPAQFTTKPLLASVLPTGGLPPASVVSSGSAGGSKL